MPANIKWMLPKTMASVKSNQVLRAKRHFVDRAFPPLPVFSAKFLQLSQFFQFSIFFTPKGSTIENVAASIWANLQIPNTHYQIQNTCQQISNRCYQNTNEHPNVPNTSSKIKKYTPTYRVNTFKYKIPNTKTSSNYE